MSKNILSRRKMIQGTLLLGASACAPITKLETSSADAQAAPVAPPGRSDYTKPSDVEPREKDFNYEVQLSEAQWREQLSKEEYRIMREGGTEKQKVSELWNNAKAGDYRCKACSLLTYSSEHKVNLKKGYAFFRHSEPDSVLTGIDLETFYNVNGEKQANVVMEAHCRRCGSHLGHLLYMNKEILHCINGTALNFEGAA